MLYIRHHKPVLCIKPLGRNALEHGYRPEETIYDGYLVIAVLDAAYRSVRS